LEAPYRDDMHFSRILRKLRSIKCTVIIDGERTTLGV
jgi:hypothetical protein